jgi:very-short-patch-repair endonuclease
VKRFINDTSQKGKRILLRRNETTEEQIIWKMLRNRSTGYKWRRQVSIGRYVADFYCSELKMVIEVDGSQHIESAEYDKMRSELFESIGILTLRFWNNEVRESRDGVYMRIIRGVESRKNPEDLK